jgi:hypothetical protein
MPCVSCHSTRYIRMVWHVVPSFPCARYCWDSYVVVFPGLVSCSERMFGRGVVMTRLVAVNVGSHHWVQVSTLWTQRLGWQLRLAGLLDGDLVGCSALLAYSVGTWSAAPPCWLAHGELVGCIASLACSTGRLFGQKVYRTHFGYLVPRYPIVVPEPPNNFNLLRGLLRNLKMDLAYVWSSRTKRRSIFVQVLVLPPVEILGAHECIC